MKKLLLFGGLGLVTYSLYTYYKKQLSILSKSKISLGSIKIVYFKLDRIKINIGIDVKNDSEQEFTISNYNLNLYLNDNYIGKVNNSNVDVVVKGNGRTSRISFDYEFNPNENGIGQALYQTLANKTGSPLRVLGTVSVKIGMIKLNIPIDYTSKLKDFM